jgi:hypothetical protein
LGARAANSPESKTLINPVGGVRMDLCAQETGFRAVRRRLRLIERFIDPSLYPGPEPDGDPHSVRNAAEALVGAALLPRMDWERTVVPRLERFRTGFPQVTSVSALQCLIGGLTEAQVANEVLGIAYNTPANRRPSVLRELVQAFDEYRRRHEAVLDEPDVLQHWAAHSPDHPRNWLSQVEGVGESTIEALRSFARQMGSPPDMGLVEHGLEAIGLERRQMHLFCTWSGLTVSQFQRVLVEGLGSAPGGLNFDNIAPLVDWDSAMQRSIESLRICYEAGALIPRTEADLQAFIYGQLVREADREDSEGYWEPLRLHSNWRTGAFPRSLRGAKMDIVAGSRDLAVELKLESDYPGVSRLMVLEQEARRDVQRLRALKEAGFESCHFVMIDEDGAHTSNTFELAGIPVTWQVLRSPFRDRDTGLLHLVL